MLQAPRRVGRGEGLSLLTGERSVEGAFVPSPQKIFRIFFVENTIF